MKKLSFLFIIFCSFILVGCQLVNQPSGKLGQPPTVHMEISGQEYPTILGAYCWHNKNRAECTDTAGPIELAQDKEPIQVGPGEQITFIINYMEPDSELLEQFNTPSYEDVTAIKISDDSFEAPLEEGIYYYSYSLTWTDKGSANNSYGDAVYAFALEVK
ncbi:hypothetical protein [Ornithinibacillus halotolerans]|uniref:Lipoprotein n=1 Tax=Ornithinibacillus halotolerans TaxID=1274357 RepID=A0A916RV41_9BACI|nr:hypothetical protein [Ornithinibacillus halotolerans]GGA72555.1 hypothetical protein GCM10008025_15430 [Ornithinibacillus halotolerans]